MNCFSLQNLLVKRQTNHYLNEQVEKKEENDVTVNGAKATEKNSQSIFHYSLKICERIKKFCLISEIEIR